MIIREATEKDIPEIVEVLKASLGEDQLELSEEVWRYKHINNPFGKSIVLLAEENKKIIGVRALMRWQWQKEEKVFSALRAVDTATHPEHQGKGIFKKLTLQAVEIAKKEGVHFIFNTPNDKSRPGYLKMGWSEVNKIKIGLKVPLNSFWKITQKRVSYSISLRSTDNKIQSLCTFWNRSQKDREKIFTPKSREFLRWRYEINPLQQYEVFASDDFYIAFYVKNRKGIKELRIADCIHGKGKEGEKNVRKELNRFSQIFNAQFISFSPSLMSPGVPSISGNFGPILTINSLNLEKEVNHVIFKMESWNNSIGDLELF
ncbi:GNAT family N-acetyltransferase [Salinimicrobium xinjiangense]|uniref:GNAT family N-acetyltransferase n=1 Tax=Salinimicrobium xinjiangense TaxID=438596 RepID=UPI00040AFDCD|nr:GNAT family N-acetyltransferase [Salinimicrobium xinjiangense]